MKSLHRIFMNIFFLCFNALIYHWIFFQELLMSLYVVLTHKKVVTMDIKSCKMIKKKVLRLSKKIVYFFS